MTRRLGMMLFALSLLVVATLQSDSHAQTITIGPGRVRYSGYGQGYYGGYNQGNNGYSPFSHRYSGYGNGPYWYGSGNGNQFPSNAVYRSGNQTYYNGYDYSGDLGQYYVPVYSPFGYEVSDYGYNW